ncbi:hypothetical protein JCM16814_34690 [Desulfobaculum senezii]
MGCWIEIPAMVAGRLPVEFLPPRGEVVEFEVDCHEHLGGRRVDVILMRGAFDGERFDAFERTINTVYPIMRAARWRQICATEAA